MPRHAPDTPAAGHPGRVAPRNDWRPDAADSRWRVVCGRWRPSTTAAERHWRPDSGPPSSGAVAVLAPHPFHAALTLDCLAAGAHVLVEKPIAVQVAEADLMIEAAERAGRLLAVNLQHRTRSEIRTADKLIQSGRLGDIQRVEMVAIWTRTTSYYAQAGWRGTWQGEGGGVLMNQSSHSLDLVCHLVGQPGRVVAWNRTLFHAIETEDTSMA